MLPPRRPFDAGLPPTRARLLPWASVIAGSLLTALPVAAVLPLMPPFGLLMLLAWRLAAPLALRIWAPALLGLFDDLVSGQPLGSGMLLWQCAVFLAALVEQRTIFRDFWQDWLIAAGLIAFVLVGGRVVATPLGAHVDHLLMVQIVIAILAFPVAAWLVGWCDRARGHPDQ